MAFCGSLPFTKGIKQWGRGSAMLEKAIEIAARVHAGQMNRAGEPYILHSLRVMLACKTELDMVFAALHDTVENTDMTLDDLRREGFGQDVMTVVDTFSRREGEKYRDFITRILENRTACRIKLADLAGNMRMAAIPHPTGKNLKRMGKYKKAAKRVREVLRQAEGER